MINGRTLPWTILGAVWLVLGLFAACKGKEKLPDLGTSVSGPIDVATSPSGKYFYALNSDYQRRYNEGSLLVIDPNAADGNYKKLALTTRRMGRSLQIAQNLLLITFDDPEKINQGYAELWNVAEEAQPVQVASWNLECSPLNGVIAPSRPFFAVSCVTGELYMGSWTDGNLPGATLERVRSYGHEHRALYFYEASNKTWLLGFPSDSGEPQYSDLAREDRRSYILADDKVVDVPNVVPDDFELTAPDRRRAGLGLPYQMFAYNVTDELAASEKLKAEGDTSFQRFRLVELGNPYNKPTLANLELNYVHFILREASGQPNTQEGSAELYKRIYRTNFYEAKRGPDSQAGTFYISQRGNSPGSAGNNVLKFTIDDAALGRLPQEEIPFEEIFTVERVYGYEQDRDTTGRFPSDFEFAEVDGEPLLLINHFRDLINFPDATFYGITRKFLNSSRFLERPSSADATGYTQSYFQIAASPDGKVLTGSFYGDALFLFDANPRISMKDQIPIRIE